MKITRTLIVAVAFAALTSTGKLHAANPNQRPTDASVVSTQRAVLDQYCVTCHSEKLLTGGLALDKADLAHVSESADVWEKVIRKLRAGAMPPPGRRRPDKETSDSLVAWLEGEIDQGAAVKPNPGPAEVFHRLNRTEYHNVVRDLLGLDIDVASLLPGDDLSYGFDNIAGILKVSPTLLERYMSAAQQISRVAIADPRIPPAAQTIRLKSDLSQHDRSESLPVGTRGGAAIPYLFPVDGEYDITAELAESLGARIADTHQLEIGVDGARAKLFTIAPPARDARAAYLMPDEPSKFTVRVPVKAGSRVIAATFLKKTSAIVETLREPFQRPHTEGDVLSEPYIASVTITGPFGASASDGAASRQRLFVCRPTNPVDETSCATKILTTLARRAYRRPVTEADVRPLLSFFREGRSKGGFDAGIERALRALLVSPEFLFRVERGPANVARGTVYRLSDLELASRLSFFIWSSIPDDELLDIASRGRLKEPQVLEQQVRRMLAHERAEAFSRNFAGQWLLLRNLPAVTPNDFIFPDFGEDLRVDFRRETELFFDSIVRENRSVLELLTANYTFLNERLARHYGMTDVYGSSFRRVPLTDPNRRGLLGQGSILTVTSYSDRTSPVLRGKWILENLLGTPPPDPPPNVPALKDTNAAGKMLTTMRERMLQHRANPVCASCHAQMDPLGFSLENFDATGRWRTRSELFTAIDASAVLSDGTTFDGPAGLRGMLLARRDQVVSTLASKLLVYALGRGVDYYDAPAIRAITRASASGGYTFSSLIVGIVKSIPFQMRKVADAPAAATTSVGP